MATKIGYQSGALKTAEVNGIDLLVIRQPEDTDYDWLDLDLKFRGHVARVLWHELFIVPDWDWCAGVGIGPEKLTVTGVKGKTKIFLEDKSTGEITTMGDLQEELSVFSRGLALGERQSQVLPDEDQVFNDTWLVLPKEDSPDPIKILQLSVPYMVEEGSWMVRLVRVTEQDSTVIKDALRDEHTFYNSLGRSTGGKGHC